MPLFGRRPRQFGHTRKPAKRKGTWGIWFKRNWLLVILVAMALAGVILSLLLFLNAGCKKKTRYNVETRNVTVNVTNYTTTSSIQNVTRNVSTPFNITTTMNVTSNVSYPVRINVTRQVNISITVNTTVNMTVYTNVSRIVNMTQNVTRIVNVTYLTNETYTTNYTVKSNATTNTTTYQPMDVVVTCDSSGSMSDTSWDDSVEAAKTLLTSFRNAVNTTVQTAMATWSSVSKVVYPLQKTRGSDLNSWSMERNPSCVPVQTSQGDVNGNVNCQGYGYSGTSPVNGYSNWAPVIFTWFNQAILRCVEEFEQRGQLGSFRVCEVITDGVLSEDEFKVDSTNYPYGEYEFKATSSGALAPADNPDETVPYFQNCPSEIEGMQECPYYGFWVAPGAYKFCEDRRVSPCTVTEITQYMKKQMNITLAVIMVGEFDDDDKKRMYGLSSCDKAEIDEECIYLTVFQTFAELESSAEMIAGSIAAQTASSTQTLVSQKTDTRKNFVVSTKKDTQTSKETAKATVQAQETTTQAAVQKQTAQASVTQSETQNVVETREETVATSTTQQVTVQQESISRETSVEKVEVTNAETSEKTNLESNVNQEDFCVGDGVSFAFLLLALPLLVYLLLKPIQHFITRFLFPPEEEDRDSMDAIEMNMNPAFGRQDRDDTDAPAVTDLKSKERKVDTSLAVRAHKKAKKKVISAHETPKGADADNPMHFEDNSPNVTSDHHDIEDIEPEHRGSIVGVAAGIAAGVAGVAAAVKQDKVEWDNGLAAVYDGDDWQESVANAFIKLVTCGYCRKSG